MKIEIKFKSLDPKAKAPVFGSAGAACFDLSSIEFASIAPGKSQAIRTGLAFELPQKTVMLVYSRSGHGFKNGIRLGNGTGVIDSDYRGEVMVCLHNDGAGIFEVKPGDRIAQAMVLPLPELEIKMAQDLSQTERGAGGFGSTGTR